MISKIEMQEKNTKRLEFQDFNFCPNVLHAVGDADAGGVAIALLHLSVGMLKSI